MTKAMTKTQLAARIAEKAGITKKAATDILEDIAAIAYKEAKNSFTLPGLGKHRVPVQATLLIISSR